MSNIVITIDDSTEVRNPVMPQHCKAIVRRIAMVEIGQNEPEEVGAEVYVEDLREIGDAKKHVTADLFFHLARYVRRNEDNG